MTAAAIAAPPAPRSLFDQAVTICQIAREFELWLWLCPRHVAARIAAGWAIRVRKLAPPSRLLVFLGPAGYCAAALDDRTVLPCDDCRREKRN